VVPVKRAAVPVKRAAVQVKLGDPALALIKAGITAQVQRQPASAVRDLRAATGKVPKLADYIAYSLAVSEYDLGDFKGALADIEPVWNNVPPSPLTGDAALLSARAYKELGNPAGSVRVLREYYSQLPQPAGDGLLAACYRAAADLVSAAVYAQRVYYNYPMNGEAESAAGMLSELRTALGELYPPPTTQAMFQRAEKLTQAGEYRRARVEYQAMLTSAAGSDREVARVRLGVLDLLAHETGAAYSYLTALDVSSPEADSERLYYLAECARRQDRDDLIMDVVKRLERYPQSPWRLKALFLAGNRYLLANRAELYVPLYRACYESFPDQPQADYCHWKVTWNAYLQRSAEAVDLLREHLKMFPGSDRASAALYFLGRLAEAGGALDMAKAYYSEILDRFPNHYYDDLADRRLADPALFGVVESPDVRMFLRGVWPLRRFQVKFEPSPATQARIERAHLLEAAGLGDEAETELRYGARKEDQPHVLAIHLAQIVDKYSEPHRALHLIRSLTPGYLSIAVEDAPASFWRLLYPMPWRTELERNARLNGLDQYVVAGLIRQESEFNPGALSPAQAYGLTQILPSTGRMLLKASKQRFRPAVLFQPEVSLRLGTTYLRSIYDNCSGRWELALASYNAGASRVQTWLTWGQYREPAEFIETIPFTETRNYVFAVLRNASMYRKLYSEEASGPLAAARFSPPVRKVVAAAVAAPAVKKRSFNRNPVVVTKRHHAVRHSVPHRKRAKVKR
jgi:soluble lytic murein transglycosylase